jgi:hypothetical protein
VFPSLNFQQRYQHGGGLKTKSKEGWHGAPQPESANRLDWLP